MLLSAHTAKGLLQEVKKDQKSTQNHTLNSK